MFKLPRHSLQTRRQILSGICLIGFVLSVVGLPLPARVAKDLSQPFPCQHRVCGCSNAAQCSHHCCCFTEKQKLAWAAKHQVQPPTFVVQRLQQPPSTHTSACATLCHAPQLAIPRSSQSSKVRVVTVSQVECCVGLHSLWCMIGSGCLEKPTAWYPESPLVGHISGVPSPVPSLNYPPQTPPPRCLGVLLSIA